MAGASKFSEGSWGLIRVLDKPVGDLQPLPNKAYGKEGIPERLPVCPKEAPVKSFNVVAMDHPGMSFNSNAPETIEVDFERKIELRNPEAKIYVLEDEVQKVGGDVQPMPLTLRANVGDCIQVKLTNKLKEGRASFSAFRTWPLIPKIPRGQLWGTTPATKRWRPVNPGPTPIMRIPSMARRKAWCGIGGMCA